MKLYEFVDKIEAMGEVEKKTETLNESADTSSAFWGDYWEGPIKKLNESLTEDNLEEGIVGSLAGAAIRGLAGNAIQNALSDEDLDESLNEAMNDDFIKIYKTSDSIPNDAWDFPIEELDYLLEEHPGESFALLNNRLYEISDESLTEAANPENAEVNAVLRKWANSDRNRISKRDQKVLDDAGIKLKTNKYDAPHKYAVHKDNEGDILDLHRMDKRHIKNTHPDHDLANDLATTGRHWSNRDRYNKNKDPNFPWRNDAYREETPEESKALRPYSDEYKRQKRIADYESRLRGSKNESLNESNFEFGDYRDEFYSLIDGMDPVDVVDMMVSYMNEYDMDDLIKSLRAEVSVPDMEEE